MNEGSKPAALTTKHSERAEWTRPEVCRMEAGKAEIGTAANADALNTAS